MAFVFNRGEYRQALGRRDSRWWRGGPVSAQEGLENASNGWQQTVVALAMERRVFLLSMDGLR